MTKKKRLQWIIDNLPLNKFQLDEEATKQSEIMWEASQFLVEARDNTLKAKNRLEIVEMDIISDIHKNPNKYNLPKTTDAVVTKAVKSSEEYQEAFEEYLDAKKEEDEYALLMDNIRQRGHQIKILTELWLNNYYVETTTETHRKRPALKRLKE